MESNQEIESINKQDLSEIKHVSDTSEGYVNNYIIDKKAISKQNFDLDKKDNFATRFALTDWFNRDNILYFGILNGEQVIDSKDTSGDIELSIVKSRSYFERNKKIKKWKENPIYTYKYYSIHFEKHLFNRNRFQNRSSNKRQKIYRS